MKNFCAFIILVLSVGHSSSADKEDPKPGVEQIKAVLKKVEPGKISVSVQVSQIDGKYEQRTLDLAQKVIIKFDDKVVEASELKLNTTIRYRIDEKGQVTETRQATPKAIPSASGFVASGTLKSIDSGKITLSDYPSLGKEKTFELSSNLKIRLNSNQAKAKELTLEKTVRFAFDEDSKKLSRFRRPSSNSRNLLGFQSPASWLGFRLEVDRLRNNRSTSKHMSNNNAGD